MLPSGFALCGITVACYARAGTPAPTLGPGGASIRCKSRPEGALRLRTEARLLMRISHERGSGPQARCSAAARRADGSRCCHSAAEPTLPS